MMLISPVDKYKMNYILCAFFKYNISLIDIVFNLCPLVIAKIHLVSFFYRFQKEKKTLMY